MLSIIVLAASTLQSATGVGFGVIAGPALLIFIGNSTAIQVSVALSLLISAIISFTEWRHAEKCILVTLSLGSVFGIPPGLWLLGKVRIDGLKMVAGVVILLLLGNLLGLGRSKVGRNPKPAKRPEIFGIGVVSGLMNGILAMPGPAPAAWMAGRSFNKNATRGTILSLFVFSYALALAFQVGFVGMSNETTLLISELAPSTLLGALLGKWVSRHVSESQFKWLLVGILGLTAISLFVSSFTLLV